MRHLLRLIFCCYPHFTTPNLVDFGEYSRRCSMFGSVGIANWDRRTRMGLTDLMPRRQQWNWVAGSLIMLVLTLSACSRAAEESGSSQSQRLETIEYKLATADSGTYVRPDDIVVARYRSLLSQLAERWRESSAQIADISVATKLQLRADGVDQKLLDFLEGMNLITPAPGKGFAEYAALYVVMRSQGRSHAIAMAALQVAESKDFP
jgi:hypothetical protein